MLLCSTSDMLVYDALTYNCTTMNPISYTPHTLHGVFTKRLLAANSSQRLVATGWLHCLLLIVAGLMLSSTVLAQTFPNPNRCTSKDLELVSASITGTGCVTCTANTTLTSDLTIAINNSTGSERTSFAFWGTLTIKNANGSLFSATAITGCVGPVPPNAITSFSSATYPGLPKVTYTCGQSLTITNLYLAWTDAADNTNRQCPLDPSKIAPKCGTLPSLAIITPLTAAVTSFTKPCAGTKTGSITVTATGGKPPYTYSLDDVTYQNSATFSGLEAKPYTIYVKDASSPACKYSFSYVLGSETGPAAPGLTPTQPTCTSATGSVTVTAPLGTGLTYSLDNGSFGTATTFGSLSPGSYCVRVKNAAGCISDPTCVTINAQPPTPAGPSVIITEASLCGTATAPTLTICNPVVGTKYDVYERNGSSLIQSTTYASGALTITMREGKGFSIVATSAAGCVSDATTCSNTPTRIVAACSAGRIADAPTKTQVVGKDILTEAYPNPTSKDATIDFSVPQSGHVLVSVYDAMGRPVATLFDGEVLAGERRSVVLKGGTLAAGTYTYRVVANGKTKTNRVILDR